MAPGTVSPKIYYYVGIKDMFQTCTCGGWLAPLILVLFKGNSKARYLILCIGSFVISLNGFHNFSRNAISIYNSSLN